MRTYFKYMIVAMVLCNILVSAVMAKGPDQRMVLGGDVLQQYTPATHYVWTDKLWYLQGADSQVNLYWTADPRDDPYPYTIFVYLENITTGERQYVSNNSLGMDVVDVFGNASGSYMPTPIPQVSKQLLVFPRQCLPWATGTSSPNCAM